MKRVAVVGSRGFSDREKLFADLDRARGEWGDFEVVSGGARGADSLAEEWALARGLPVRVFPADWNRWGKSAGFRRNRTIVENAEVLIAFWDGESRGTANTIDIAREAGLPVFIRRV